MTGPLRITIAVPIRIRAIDAGLIQDTAPETVGRGGKRQWMPAWVNCRSEMGTNDYFARSCMRNFLWPESLVGHTLLKARLCASGEFMKNLVCRCLRFPYFDVRIGLRRRLGHKSTSSGRIDTLQRGSQRCNDRPRILRAWIIAAGRHGSDDSRQRTVGGGLRC